MIYSNPDTGIWTSVNRGRPYNPIDENLRAQWIARNQQAYQQQLANQQALMDQYNDSQSRLRESFLRQQKEAVDAGNGTGRTIPILPTFDIWGNN